MAMLVKGWASTAAIDKNNQRIMPGALTQLSLPIKHVPLLYRHGEKEIKDPIGKINKLEGRDGKLWTEVVVTNMRVVDAIKRKVVTGFSVHVAPTSTIKKVGHVEITKGALVELSLVCQPANPQCIIVSTEEFTDHLTELSKHVSKQYDCLSEAIKATQKYIEQIKKAHAS